MTSATSAAPAMCAVGGCDPPVSELRLLRLKAGAKQPHPPHPPQPHHLVRRQLFGCSPHGRDRDSARRALRDDQRRRSERWSFDFANEKPLPGGRYRWLEPRQALITEFMKPRKRAASDDTSSPVKMARISSNDASSMYSNVIEESPPV